MKIRIKFEKTGAMKFIGHLDVMRYFQKVMRRADVDIMYSEGYSPHQIMSFAAPLGVGLTSKGEYLDIEVNSSLSSKEMVDRINSTNVEGINVVSFKRLPDDCKNAMSIVTAADYLVRFREDYKPDIDIKNEYEKFLSSNEINVVKTSKKSESVVDIRPMILESYVNENDEIFMKVMSGSANNLKPELVIGALYNSLGRELGKYDIEIQRLEIYGLQGENVLPLEKFGEDIN